MAPFLFYERRQMVILELTDNAFLVLEGQNTPSAQYPNELEPGVWATGNMMTIKMEAAERIFGQYFKDRGTTIQKQRQAIVDSRLYNAMRGSEY